MSISIDSINIISSCIAKASAISHLLTENGADMKDGFLCNHEIIVDSIWAISELLDEARQEFLK